jgi:hypothetical protein
VSAAAQLAVTRGWAVIPLHGQDAGRCHCGRVECSAQGKHPIWPAWQTRGLVDLDQARHIFAQYPRANVGVLTGAPSNLWVLDVDKPAALVALIEQYGMLPSTWTQRTGSGGWHYGFLLPPDFTVTNYRGTLPKGIDVRGQGGQIVLAPSVSHKGPYVVVRDVPPVAAPDWLLDQIRPPTRAVVDLHSRATPSPALTDAKADELAARMRAYVDAAADRVYEQMANAGEGGRNAALFAGACRLVEIANHPDMPLSHAAAEDIVYDAAGVNGLPQVEARTVWQSAVRRVGGKRAPAPTDRPFESAPTAPVATGLGEGLYMTPDHPGYSDEFLRRLALRKMDLRVTRLATKQLEQEEREEEIALAALATPRFVNTAELWDAAESVEETTIGMVRDDNVQLLYPGKWHTLTGLSGSGKSLLALAHARDEMQRADGQGMVVYLHFEESGPSGTIGRLKAMGVTKEQADEHFVFMDDCMSTKWTEGLLAANLDKLPRPPTLIILDGIKAAAGVHGWDVRDETSVGNYRRLLVVPGLVLGAAVLSLGHPVKDRLRQSESHGHGASGWLDEVDGACFRLEASSPMAIGRKGASRLFTTKDRPSGINPHCTPADEREVGWHYAGTFIVDSSERYPDGTLRTQPRLAAPQINAEAPNPHDPIDALGLDILEALRANEGRFESVNTLRDILRSRKATFRNEDLTPALIRLEGDGMIEWPKVKRRVSRPGRLVEQLPEVSEP